VCGDWRRNEGGEGGDGREGGVPGGWCAGRRMERAWGSVETGSEGGITEGGYYRNREEVTYRLMVWVTEYHFSWD